MAQRIFGVQSTALMLSEPLTGADIRAYLSEVAQALPDFGPQHNVILVGGSLLAWMDIRESTRDVDSIVRLEEELREAIQTIATRHDLAPRWMNDDAKAFAPATLNRQSCTVLPDPF